VGTKLDLADRREVSTQDGQDFAHKHGMRFLETSAKTNAGVTEAFMELATTAVNKQSRAHIESGHTPKLSAGQPVENKCAC